MHSPYYYSCNFIDCDEVGYNEEWDYYLCDSCLQGDQVVLEQSPYYDVQVYQPIAHYRHDEFCYVDCEDIEDQHLVNGLNGICECKEGYGWEDEPYYSECVSCDQKYSGCGECDFDTDECTSCLNNYDVIGFGGNFC